MAPIDIESIRAVCDQATLKRPVLWGYSKETTYEDQVREFEVCLRRRPEVASAIVHVPVEDDGDGATSEYLAITGNGPSGEANARYIAASFDAEHGWRACADEIERLRAVLADVRKRLADAGSQHSATVLAFAVGATMRAIDDAVTP